MKYFAVFGMLLTIVVVCLLSSVSESRVAYLEDRQYYSMGIASERRIYDFSDPAFVSEIESKGNHVVESNEEVTEHSIFAEGGSLTLHFDVVERDLGAGVESKVPIDELDYRSFAFPDRLPALFEPLDDLEVCYVFSRIVASSTLAVPIRASLEEITFCREEDSLLASAKIDICFSDLKEAYQLDWLPDHACLFLSMPFFVKNSEISVDYDGIILYCETFDLPEALLIFGCNVAFGKRDYRTLFGEAVRNVFVNAGIYR